MSFALPAVLLLLLALPGFIFVYAYRGQLRPKNDALVSNASMTLGWVLGLLGAIIAHAAWVPLANEILQGFGSGLKVDTDSVAYLLAGEYRDNFEQHGRSFTSHANAVLLYFLTLYVAAALLVQFLIGSFEGQGWTGSLPCCASTTSGTTSSPKAQT